MTNFNEAPRSTRIEGVIGEVSPDYAEEYLREMAKLQERIATNTEILGKTKDASEMKFVGQLLRRDREALRELKTRNGVPLDENEKLAA